MIETIRRSFQQVLQSRKVKVKRTMNCISIVITQHLRLCSL